MMDAGAALELLHQGDAAGALELLGDAAGLSEEMDAATLVALGIVQLANDHSADALIALRRP